ncbi:MAG TPA: hypothetical protein VGR56_04330 [Nitrososphaerales archaeon]|nr:hypothetical protein [Nitrososphaerales archaeon]
MTQLTNWNGLSTTGNPPDASLAVSTNYIVETLRFGVQVYSKTGTALSYFSLSNFFGTGTDYITDPQVAYTGGHFFATVADFTSDTVKLRVTATGDPTANWNKWDFLTYNAYCPDQPTIGYDPGVFSISVNLFDTGCPAGATYYGVWYWIINQNNLDFGQTANYYTPSSPMAADWSIHPSQDLGSSSVQYFAETGHSGVSSLFMFVASGTPPNPVTVTEHVLSTRQFNTAPSAVEPGTSGTGVYVDTGDNRATSVTDYNGKLWVAANDLCYPGSDRTARSCVRMIQVDTGSWAVNQDFDIGAEYSYYFYGSLSIDYYSNIDIVVGQSSSSIYPSVLGTGQKTTDPVNTWEVEISLQSGVGNIGGGTTTCGSHTCYRWGDYFGAGLDQADVSKVWVVGEYGTTSTTTYGTWISQIAVS